jgi:hypothetical protein
LLARVRWVFLLLALFDVGLTLALVGTSDAPLALRVGATAACAAIAWR